jgi:hypothetical protein
MTSKKVKDAIRSSDMFEIINNDVPADTSFQSIDSQLYSALEQVEANRQIAYAESIFEIRPDFAQPRRAIPKAVRDAAGWDKDSDLKGIGVIFTTWEQLVTENRKKRGQPDFNLKNYLNRQVVGDKDIEHDAVDLLTDVSSLEQSLLELVELATSIYADGLAHPITVVQVPGKNYIIETGERRWLAYHLLYWHTAEEKYAKIAARSVNQLNIWRQASENNTRANLNAISKARQFAVLLMDLLREKEEISFTPYSEFQSSEQAYYAQVEDGNQYRIPRGTSERLLNATGLKSGKQLREYRQLLRLPKIVWEIADDLNWAERAIRDLTNRAMNEEDLVWLAIKKAESEGYTVPMGTLSPKRPVKLEKQEADTTASAVLGERQYFNDFLKVLGRAKSGKLEAVDEAYEKIEEIRRWLDEQEFQLSQLDD